MTKKAKVIAGVVGGVLVLGGIGSLTKNTDKESSYHEDNNSSINDSSNYVKNEKIYTEDEFCQLFEDDDNFANNHKGETFTIVDTIRRERDVTYGQIKIRSSFTSKKHMVNYWIYFHFKDNKVLDGLDANYKVKLNGTLVSHLTTNGHISLNDCTIISVENLIPDNSSSSEESSGNSTSEQSSEPEQSSTTESEPQSTPQEPESSSEVSSVPSSVSESESTSTVNEPISSVPESSSALSVPSADNSAHEVCIATSGNGKKYHRDSSCSKMNGNVRWLSISEAQALGYSACKKCA